MRRDLGLTLDPAWTFLNHGSFGACPAPVLAAQDGFRERLERQPVRFLDRELPGLLAETRGRLGAFLGADPEGLAFVPNATTGVNAVLASVRFRPGDELLTTDHEYNAVINAMRVVAERDGARVVIAPIALPVAGDDAVVEAILCRVTERTRLLVVSHVTSPTALVLPVGRLVQELASRGVDTLIDGAHAPGMVPLELDTLGAAYYTGNAHKWLCAPKGAAFLWVRGDRRPSVRPVITSHGWNELPGDVPRFRAEFDWVGTGDPSAVLAIPAALDWLAAGLPGGVSAVMDAQHEAAVTAGGRVASALGVEPLAPPSMLGAMASVRLPGVTTEGDGLAVKATLEAAHVEAPIVGFPVRAARPQPDASPAMVLVRVSTPRYVESSDVERLVEVLGSALASVAGGRSAAAE
jgi:isopenicillin-N epimerase